MKINCESKDYLQLNQLEEFQGELKSREKSDIEKIIKSIKRFGFVTPFLVWKHDGINSVLDGHGRLLGLNELAKRGEAIPALPVVYLNIKDEDDAKRVLLRINSQYGKMTAESVTEFMEGLDIEVEEIALPENVIQFDIENKLEETEADDETPEVQEQAVSQYGEMYELGNSILLCGDSLNPEEVENLIMGNYCSLTFTDPPYELGTEGGGILKQTNSMKQISENGVNHFEPSKLKLYSDTNIYFHNKPLIKKYIELAELNNKPYDLAFYKKTNTVPNYKGHLMTDCEYIAIIGNQDPNKGLSKELYSKCFIGKKDKDNNLSYSKPVELCEKYLKLYAKDNVLDLFGGSGSTLIACEKLGFKCFMIEKNPIFADVIRRRYTRWAKENNKSITSGCLE